MKFKLLVFVKYNDEDGEVLFIQSRIIDSKILDDTLYEIQTMLATNYDLVDYRMELKLCSKEELIKHKANKIRSNKKKVKK